MKLTGVKYLFVLILVTNVLAGFSQFTAGGNDTINPGVPVTLSASFGLLANEVLLQDNSVVKGLNIGFPFTFYGNTYNQFSIGENGWISFASVGPEYWGATRNIRLPSAAPTSPKNCILGAMEDYNPESEGSPFIFYQTVGQAPDRKLIVMWCQCPMFGCITSTVTFQIVLKEGGTIETHIFSKPVCTLWDNKCTIGIQDETGFRCDTLPNKNRNSTSWSASMEGWQFTPTTSDTYDVTQIPYQIEPITPGDKISYSWHVGSEFISDQQTIVVAPNETTTYRASCTLCNGETFYQDVKVVVVPYIPNAFTPNGDGLNDSFKILGLPPENITEFNLQIFDRWGQVIFRSSDIRESWDGRINGAYGEEGYYTWVIFYEDNNKNKNSNKGSVMLLR